VALRIAVKRLSSVEVDPRLSNQHEFHATRLRRELELPEHRVTGLLSFMILGRDDSEPTLEEAQFTLYDSREGHPTRTPEWRLYYYSKLIPEVATPGDLLVLYRHEAGLRALIVRAGSSTEGDLLSALSLDDRAIREQFSYLDAPSPDERETVGVAHQLTLPTEPKGDYEVSDHALYRRAVRDGYMPTTREMATAAVDIVGRRGETSGDPDAYLSAALSAETDLYYGIETEIHTGRLSTLMATQPTVTDVIDFAMGVQQSRRSRRGQSLQNHFAAVLASHKVPFTAQCRTEDGETPDFVVPGCDVYHDETFPAARLRMVACKSTAKERWRQVLHEAARIPEKYLLTLDPFLTDATVVAMDDAGVTAFLPRAILAESYELHPRREELGSVRDLVDRLRAVL
jgi:EcoRII C terminal